MACPTMFDQGLEASYSNPSGFLQVPWGVFVAPRSEPMWKRKDDPIAPQSCLEVVGTQPNDLNC